MKRVAFVTYSKLLQVNTDEQPAAELLQQHDVTVEAVPWDDQTAAWDSYNALVLRACWDYHVRFDEFQGWLGKIQASGVPLWNPPDVVRWNANKTYLGDLAAKGVNTIPTHWLNCGSSANLDQELARLGWDKAIVKPTISASAHDTWLTSHHQADGDQERFDTMLAKSDVMIQPFVEEIRTKGEWSFIFLGGQYSHAVVKLPQDGDFRVQREYGGTSQTVEPSDSLLEQARQIVAAVESPLLYTRVDAVELGGKLALMELELIEPFLFLGADPQGNRRFADAILAALK